MEPLDRLKRMPFTAGKHPPGERRIDCTPEVLLNQAHRSVEIQGCQVQAQGGIVTPPAQHCEEGQVITEALPFGVGWTGSGRQNERKRRLNLSHLFPERPEDRPVVGIPVVCVFKNDGESVLT